MFEEFGLVMVVVSDMARSVAFYRDVLGLKLTHESSEWSNFQVGHVMLGLHPQSLHLPANTSGGISFGFYVSSLEATLEALAAHGISPAHTSEEGFGSLAIIPDPDGYGIQLCQAKHGH